MTDIIKVADGADIIVNGYAFTKSEEGYRGLLSSLRPYEIRQQTKLMH